MVQAFLKGQYVAIETDTFVFVQNNALIGFIN